MEQHIDTEEGEQDREELRARVGVDENQGTAAMSRKEKRKAMKKMKRKHMRKEVAEKEREEVEARLSDPAELERLRAAEEEEARRREKELKEFEERERAWFEAMELKRKKEEEAEREEEERRKKDLEERNLKMNEKNECDEDDEWEYIEEGPPEIIFQGNEIILRKKKVRVPKKSLNQVEGQELAERPTSNPLPPETEAFADFHSASSAQQVLESVAHQVPNFGTEQDKAHCPFHLKTGTCRFGQRCSRVHFYPDKSCTLLMKNMYTGPGTAWELDEGLECTDEEVELSYEEFYEDVHTEFLKYGELVNFKVQCEFVNISRWKVAICGEYMKSRLRTCSRGSACNFIHCFRNPDGEYEWADYDKPPPRYWIKKMAALFGYSDEYVRQMEHEYSKDACSDLRRDSHRGSASLSRSRDSDCVDFGSSSYRSHKNIGGDTPRENGHRTCKYENCGNDESGGSHRSESEHRASKRRSHRESKWLEKSPRKQIRERYSDDDDDDDESGYGRRSSRRRSEVREYQSSGRAERERSRSRNQRSERSKEMYEETEEGFGDRDKKKRKRQDVEQTESVYEHRNHRIRDRSHERESDGSQKGKSSRRSNSKNSRRQNRRYETESLVEDSDDEISDRHRRRRRRRQRYEIRTSEESLERMERWKPECSEDVN